MSGRRETALVLAGGYDQIALIERLRARGYRVVLADYLENPPARRAADSHVRVSTLDVAAVGEVAKAEGAEMVATACTDQALLTAALVNRDLGFDFYLTPEKAEAVTNKALMKRLMASGGVPTARHVTVDRAQAGALVERAGLGYPLVVKPCDCNSSKGVEKVRDEAGLPGAVAAALAMSRSGRAVVEEYMEGEEISVDAWVGADGTARVMSVTATDKFDNGDGSFTIFRSRYPLAGADSLMDEVRAVASAAACAFGLADCPLLVQCIAGDGGVRVIELSARMGGGTKHRLIEELSGVPIMDVYVDRLLGSRGQEVRPAPRAGAVELDYIYALDGTVGGFDGFDEVVAEGVAKQWFQYKSVGSAVNARRASGDRVAGLLLEDRDEAGLGERRRAALSMVRVTDGGRDIKYVDYFDGQGCE